MTQPKRQQPDPRPIPPLQIVQGPRLAVGVNDAAVVRVRPVPALWAGVIALGTAAAIAAPVILLTHHHGGTSAPVNAPPHPQVVARASAGVYRLPAALLADRLRSHEVAVRSHQPAVVKHAQRVAPAVPRGPLDLSLEDLATSVQAGSSAYAPPAYLVNDYRRVAERYKIPWRVLAAINYIETGYQTALGARRPAVSNGGQSLNPHVLARSVATAWQPSATLISDAHKLALDGAGQAPAEAIYKYTGSSASVQQVLTVAQQIGAEGVTTKSGPMLKLVAMQDEAHLLNGLPYIWGGGHTNPAWVVSSGYDCSGFVSEVLHAGGYLDAPQTTQTLPAMAGILNGPGKYVTLYDRTIATERVWVKKKKIVTEREMVDPSTAGVHVVGRRDPRSSAGSAGSSVLIRLPKTVGAWKTIKISKLVPSLDTTNNDEHVIIDLDGQWWESGGSSADGGAEMVHPILKPDPGYLQSFNRRLHPEGL